MLGEVMLNMSQVKSVRPNFNPERTYFHVRFADGTAETFISEEHENDNPIGRQIWADFQKSIFG